MSVFHTNIEASIDTICRFAEFAKEDASVMSNHLANNVPAEIKMHIQEEKKLIGMCNKYAIEGEYISRAVSNLRRLHDALSVYEKGRVLVRYRLGRANFLPREERPEDLYEYVNVNLPQWEETNEQLFKCHLSIVETSPVVTRSKE